MRKSEYWMIHADVLFFIFFDGPDNASVGIEMNTALTQIPGAAGRSMIAYQHNVPSLVPGLGRRYRELSLVHFSNDQELLRQACGNVERLLGRLYMSVYNRQEGEWEYTSTI